MPEAEIRAAICAEVVRLLMEERKRLGISMNKLAKATGLTQPTISILESYCSDSAQPGRTPNPKLDSLLRISRVLDINLGDVLKQAIRDIERQSALTASPKK